MAMDVLAQSVTFGSATYRSLMEISVGKLKVLRFRMKKSVIVLVQPEFYTYLVKKGLIS